MLKVLDLFSGIGGWTIGLEGTGGFEVVAAVEKEPWKRAIHRAAWPDVPVFRDILKVTGDAVRSGIGPIDCIVGSPPCQDASAANAKGRGIDGPETGLFREAVRLVRELRPRWVCLENSPRLRTRGYDRVQTWLEEAGYACWPFVVGADDLGAPHERKRVWIIAHAADARPQHGELVGPPTVQDTDGEPGRAGTGRENGPEDHNHFDEQTRDANCTGLPLGQGQRRNARAERQTIERSIDEKTIDAAREQMGRTGFTWQDDARLIEASDDCRWLVEHPWAGGLVRHLRMGDGLSAGVPAGRLADCRSAYGDAVVPEVVRCIGHAILEAERLT